MIGCGDKKPNNSSSETPVATEEVEKLEATAAEAENISQEIEESARELNEILEDLENIDEQ